MNRLGRDGASRTELATEANRARAKLMHTVEVLDRKRHDALDLKKQLRRHVRDLAIVSAFAAVAIAGGVFLLAHRLAHAHERKRRARWRLAKITWQHPERELRTRRAPLLVELGRRLLLALLTATVIVPARRGLERLLTSRQEEAH
jgi:hypothetical protein